MRTSADHILTSHVGSLPRPDELIEANRAREARKPVDETQFQKQLRAAVAQVVRRQQDIGIDVPGDGEYGKSMGQRVDYGAWMSYCYHRLGGLEFTGPDMHGMPPRRSRPGEIVLTGFSDRRDRVRFAAAYGDPDSGITIGPRPPTGPVCVGPLTYTGHAAIAADIANFKAALIAAGIDEGFMTSIAPGATTAWATRSTRPTKISCSPLPTRCARSTRRSSMLG
jgi:5-methyltetrahydropteroyltriglutamate--homocysteine methyltransferase